VLLAEAAPCKRLEPALLPLQRLGLAPKGGPGDDPALFGCCFARLGRFVYPHDLVTLRLDLERARLEPRHGGFELGKIHRFCVASAHGPHGRGSDNTRFFSPHVVGP